MLNDVQASLLRYLRNKPICYLLMQFSIILTLVYPLYLVACDFNFLNFATNVIALVSAFIYFAYVAGIVFCFAKDELAIIGFAFGIRAIDYLLRLVFFYFRFSNLLFLFLYAALSIYIIYKLKYIRQ